MIHARVSICTRSHVLETSSFVGFDLSIANRGMFNDHAFASVFLFASRLSRFIFSWWFHWRNVWSSSGSALQNKSINKGDVLTLRGIWRVQSTMSCNLAFLGGGMVFFRSAQPSVLEGGVIISVELASEEATSEKLSDPSIERGAPLEPIVRSAIVLHS